MNAKNLITLLLLTGYLHGCAENPVLKDNFGEAARSMVYHQIANPETIVNPDDEAVSGLSGEKGQRILGEHNNNVSQPDESGNVINLNIGGNK